MMMYVQSMTYPVSVLFRLPHGMGDRKDGCTAQVPLFPWVHRRDLTCFESAVVSSRRIVVNAINWVSPHQQHIILLSFQTTTGIAWFLRLKRAS